VAVASHERPVRLRWLLNALAEQTLARERWEVLVAHDSRGTETEALLREHPLAQRGSLRHFRLAPGTGRIGRQRNVALRAAHAPLVAFTDDDCRPPRDWLERILDAAAMHPGAVLQGTTEPDPDEGVTLHAAPWPHTNRVTPPTVWAQGCNIAYPRSILEQAGGFDERLVAGEDTDLAFRVRAQGASLVAVPSMLMYHAVDDMRLVGKLRSASRWGDLARVLKRHPSLRCALYGRLWWKREHAAMAALAVAVALARRNRLALALMLPWLAPALAVRGYSIRGVLRSVAELPGRAAIDMAEMLVLARASVKHRAFLL